MALKDLQILRAEDISEATRREKGLSSSGRIAIETFNDELDIKFTPIKGGIRDYLLTLGKFNDVDIPEE